MSGNTKTTIVYYSGDPSDESLHLGIVANLSSSYWYPVELESSDVKGYPSVTKLPSGNLGIAYMYGTNNTLRYGEWNGSSFTVLYTSNLDQCGYQTSVSYDDSGNPIIYSLSKAGCVMKTVFNGSTFLQFSLGLAETDEFMEENTLSHVRVEDGDILAYINIAGTLTIAYHAY